MIFWYILTFVFSLVKAEENIDVRDFSKIEVVNGGGYLYTAEKCGIACSRNNDCLVWDYNVKTQECRLFITIVNLCGDEWKNYKENCYQLITTPMSWDKGIDKCKAFGGDLASINSSDEQNVIYAYLDEHKDVIGNQNVWIGFSDSDKLWTFTWSDKSYVSWTSWTLTSGKPQSRNYKSCTLLYKWKTWRWYNVACHQSRMVLCKKTVI